MCCFCFVAIVDESPRKAKDDEDGLPCEQIILCILSNFLTPAGAQVLGGFFGHHALCHCFLPLKRFCLDGINEIT